MSALALEKSSEIIITRTVHAPIRRVWAMFTRPEHIKHWWGPNGFTNTILEMDVRVGGLWRYVMHAPENADGSPGTDYNNWIRYTTLAEPTFMAYEHGGDDPVKAEFNATVTLKDLGHRTQVTLRLILQSPAQRQQLAEFGAIEGGKQTLARLDAYVSKMP
ncbi:MAG: SRPBCC family protein [Polaromonas sp.]